MVGPKNLLPEERQRKISFDFFRKSATMRLLYGTEGVTAHRLFIFCRKGGRQGL